MGSSTLSTDEALLSRRFFLQHEETSVEAQPPSFVQHLKAVNKCLLSMVNSLAFRSILLAPFVSEVCQNTSSKNKFSLTSTSK